MIFDARRRKCTLQTDPEEIFLPIVSSDYIKLGYKIHLFQEAKKNKKEPMKLTERNKLHIIF